MKKGGFYIFICLISGFGYAQEPVTGSHFVYSVQKAVYANNYEGVSKRVEVLKFEGHIYSKKDENIYFAKPLYLDKYPNGEIETYNKNNQVGILDISVDTIQFLNYFNSKTNVRISRDMIGKKIGVNYMDTFVDNRSLYKLQNESRMIDGLECKKVILGDSVNPEWTLWICLDIPLQFNFIYPYAPGLIVEAKSKNDRVVMNLVKYNLEELFDDNIFSPPQFKEPIRKRKK